MGLLDQYPFLRAVAGFINPVPVDRFKRFPFTSLTREDNKMPGGGGFSFGSGFGGFIQRGISALGNFSRGKGGAIASGLIGAGLGSARGGRSGRAVEVPSFGGFGSSGFGGDDGNGYRPRRRRSGISGKDLRSFRKVANLIRRYAAPVRHFRTSPKRGRG